MGLAGLELLGQRQAQEEGPLVRIEALLERGDHSVARGRQCIQSTGSVVMHP